MIWDSISHTQYVIGVVADSYIVTSIYDICAVFSGLSYKAVSLRTHVSGIHFRNYTLGPVSCQISTVMYVKLTVAASIKFNDTDTNVVSYEFVDNHTHQKQRSRHHVRGVGFYAHQPAFQYPSPTYTTQHEPNTCEYGMIFIYYITYQSRLT